MGHLVAAPAPQNAPGPGGGGSAGIPTPSRCRRTRAFQQEMLKQVNTLMLLNAIKETTFFPVFSSSLGPSLTAQKKNTKNHSSLAPLYDSVLHDHDMQCRGRSGVYVQCPGDRAALGTSRPPRAGAARATLQTHDQTAP